MSRLSKLAAAAAIAFCTASLAFAQGADHDTHHSSSSGTTRNPAAPTAASGTEAPLSEGEIRKIDKDAGKLTIRHGELKNLDMPPMTMVFRVKDPAMLDQVNVGDKINFVADKVGGQFTVTQLEVKR